MLALLVHLDRKPHLAKGARLVPLARWEEARVPLRMLRDEARDCGHVPLPYVTLVKVPADARVAVIIGRPERGPPESEYFELAHLPEEKRRVIDDFFAKVRSTANIDLGAGFLARLVLGEKLSAGSVKWTKDLRLLNGNTRNASIKRT